MIDTRTVVSATPLRMMVASATIMFASVGVGFYGISVLVDQLVQSTGASVGTVGAATSIFLLASCLANPLISASMRRFGVRWTMVTGGAVAASALVLVAFEARPAMLYLAFLLLGAGSAACSYLPVSTMLVALPESRRSLALTVGYTGGTLGGVVLAPLMLFSSTHWGFHPTTVAVAVLLLGVVTFGALVLLPRGFVSLPMTAEPGIHSPTASPTLRTALRTASFWWLLVALAVTGSTATAIQLQLLSIARFADLPDPATATIVLALSVAVSRFGGVLLLRVLSTRVVSILTCGIQAAAFVLLALAPSTPVFLVGAGLVGASIGLFVMLSPLLTVDVFGSRNFASIYAVILTITGIANGVTPVLIGWWFDAATGYTLALVVFAAVCTLSAAGFAFVRLAAASPAAPTREDAKRSEEVA